MSAFTAEKREQKAPGEVLGQEAPSTPVGKETNSGNAEKMAVDGAGEGKPQATPSPAKAAGARPRLARRLEPEGRLDQAARSAPRPRRPRQPKRQR